MRILACVVLLCVAAPALSEEVAHPFRGSKFDGDVLKFSGTTPKEFISPEEEGLHVRYTPGKVAKSPAGVVWRFAVRGDFITTAQYEILQVDRPNTGFGVGVELYVGLANASKDGISYSRLLRPKEGAMVTLNIMTTKDDGKRSAKETKWFPTTARSQKGRLRLERKGTMLIASIAEADDEFKGLYRTEIGTADVRDIRVGGYSGGDPNANLDLRLVDFQLKGDEFGFDGNLPPAPAAVERPPGAPDAPREAAEGAPQPGSNRLIFLVVAILILVPLFLLMPLLLWLRLRKSKVNPTMSKKATQVKRDAEESVQGIKAEGTNPNAAHPK